ncbi:hypothetical protein CFIMG_008497RA00001 [Ceratocystis fimbriata CBS 114723]|uniref:Uncharacterized protein n=1 Tax=Ceratocystis fimbriata CBS 114723 TaxID=1035309 RepID=A0A2C5X2A8_9PEZI|nr:hypothetical protein CFIMG_008497RA00001 [Ceratocystis fimbriata CBS 114723]
MTIIFKINFPVKTPAEIEAEADEESEYERVVTMHKYSMNNVAADSEEGLFHREAWAHDQEERHNKHCEIWEEWGIRDTARHDVLKSKSSCVILMKDKNKGGVNFGASF